MAAKRMSAVEKAIKEANKALTGAIAQGDAAAAAACYTKDALLMAPNAKPMKGHTAIRKFWQGASEMGIKSATLRTAEVEAHGTTAIERGSVTLKGARNKTLDTGKYVVIWKKEGKQWKLHRDIFNSNNPA